MAAPAGREPPRTFGDYELLGEIARGGMGVIYKARQVSLGRSVALKMILDGQLASDTSVRRFYQEARAAAGLDHPNIVPIYEVGRHEDRHYFSMALVDGTSLAHAVHQGGPLPAETAAALLLAVTEAVHYAHQTGIIHRDLKPENVLLDSQGRPRVTDFGLAKSSAGDAGLTNSGQVLGTPCYMAPEQARGEKTVGPAADVYALGGILYFLLTGRPPFVGKSVMEVLCKVLEQPPLSPRQHNPLVPEALEAICLKCLEKDPARRYATAEELAGALRPLAGPPAAASGVQATRTEAQPAPRRWKWLGLAALALALLGGGAFLVTNRLAKPAGPEGAEEEEVGLPEVTHRNFALKVEMIGGEKTEADVYRLRQRQEIEFRIETDRDAYVGLWNVDPDGTIVQLFPNQYEKDNLVRAGIPRTVPRSDIVCRAKPTRGAARVWVVASTRQWDSLKGEREGPFLIFKTPAQRKQWVAARGFDIERRRTDLVSEAMLLYRVADR
jgi:tRNA A-37 threonylcarbamoyl transferase component Bud32